MMLNGSIRASIAAEALAWSARLLAMAPPKPASVNAPAATGAKVGLAHLIFPRLLASPALLARIVSGRTSQRGPIQAGSTGRRTWSQRTARIRHRCDEIGMLSSLSFQARP